ncbi:uncharacterized protein LOC129767077 [Toxorhynchites rutilus septentrionalis]|uniref:uncharacterized protein LOC129767077 n=1 Tax=Toxorhynchites rutilus septentrionalis TaxID=329112 RepID=UPI00247A4758|nr:uncharacterized protein LOC129767077 [Toxorhynchites rutilus septentrionalis]
MEYELTTVTYSLGPSSFLATRTLHQLAEDEGKSFPHAANCLKHDFYMDEFIRGESTIEKAIQLREDMDKLLKSGGFRLRKWESNEKAVLESIPFENRASQADQTFDTDDTIKTLGIVWEPATDMFRFDIQPIQINDFITKRSILSCIAKLYDPLGLISPIVIRAKVLLQHLWTLSWDWDDEVPTNLQLEWRNFTDELPNLIKFRMNRHAFGDGELQLHCFADASETAYGTCAYVRSLTENGDVRVELLASKSRVAPLQRRTIPRLELFAAQMAALLYHKIVTALDVKFQSTWFWSDSMVVLHLLRAPSQTWKTFVSNRVAEIQNLTHGSRWQHVSGATNPADLVSRGLSVEKFLDCLTWKYGPSWLCKSQEYWPTQKLDAENLPDNEVERKTTSLAVQINTPQNPLLKRFSSYNRLLRTIAYCLRFVQKAQKSPKVTSSTLSVEELENAKFTLVKLAQAECYTSELRQLRKGQAVSKSSSLKLFNPFVDSIGIVRVGGRLNLSKEPYAVKHQILLPGFHHFTLLLLKSHHLQLLHGSISLTLAKVRKEFWPTNGRRAVRNVIRNCYRCARVDPRPIKQPIGQLPPARITPGRAFSTTGIDYCRPVFVEHPYRKAAPTKAYIALFVCFATKAVHIELVGDLSTASFISALRRFIARRGKPEHMYSDNATNFAGAKNELNALYQMFSNRTTTEQISTNLATDGISWHLIPPRAPNFGGLWEAAVKVAKRHLVRQLGNTTLLYEDLVIILAQIEGCMNSRPLIPLSENPEMYATYLQIDSTGISSSNREFNNFGTNGEAST